MKFYATLNEIGDFMFSQFFNDNDNNNDTALSAGRLLFS